MSGVRFSFQWFRSDFSGSISNGPYYTLTNADSNRSISVVVTASKVGFTQVSRSSRAIRVVGVALTLTPTPTISLSDTGNLNQARTLTANPGTWDPDVQLSYQWIRDSEIIPSATQPSYQLSDLDAGKRINVRVTGNKLGFVSVSKFSEPYFELQRFLNPPTPMIIGTNTMGSTVTAVPGEWESGTSLAYQWLRNGEPIEGASNPTYLISFLDADSSISVKVTGFKEGFFNANMISDSMPTPGLDTLFLTPTPSISGDKDFNKALIAVPGTWDSGVQLSYQWLRNGIPIGGAVRNSYTHSLSDEGRYISLQVTGSKPGFASVSRSSLPILALNPKPNVAGRTTLNSTLFAVPGTWEPGVTLSYQWYKSYLPVRGAVNSSYKIGRMDVGQVIYVRVTGSKPGFISVSRFSGSGLNAPVG